MNTAAQHSSVSLLIAGNRTSIFVERGEASARITKQLRSFADVRAERVALYHEAYLQTLGAGPGVVPILGGRLDDGDDFTAPIAPLGEYRALARPYVSGNSLRVLLLEADTHRQLFRENAVQWLRQLMLTLARLHALRASDEQPLGLIHRDVTPDNVLLDDAGRIWLNDFGLARLAQEGDVPDDQLLQGSQSCLPPELLRGEQPTQRSDVYQAARLGAVLLGGLGLPPALDAALSPHAADRPTSAELVRALV